MKSFLKYLVIGALAAGLPVCEAAGKPRAKVLVKAPVRPPLGPSFAATGKVTMHPGMPCTSQIMFDFRPAHARESICLAAPAKESKILTDAAKRRRTVQISGVWQHGKEKTCRYVHITRVVVQKGFFSW
jgi:hypothetical protein